MKKIILPVLLLFSIISFAQKGNNIGVAAEVGFPTGIFKDYNKTGIGGSVKGLLGIGKQGQISLTTGFTSYRVKGSTSAAKAENNIIPILLGYRYHYHNVFLEPQIGYGFYESKTDSNSGINSDLDGQTTWAMGVGYIIKHFELGIRFQTGYKEEVNTSLIGLHLGYNFLH